MAEVADLEQSLKKGEAEAQRLDEELTRRLEVLPNLPFDDVPDGTDETANVEIRRVGNQRNFAFAPKDHVRWARRTGEMDFAAASKISGSRFVVLKGRWRKLERAHRAVHARPAHQRGGRLHRGQSALPGARQRRLRRRPAAALRRGHVPYRQRLLADPDRRGAAHQPGERHGAGREGPAAALHRLDAVLPLRGGRRRQGHARHDPPAPVPQGRAGLHHHARAVRRPSTSA